jgi:hypothetical protein
MYLVDLRTVVIIQADNDMHTEAETFRPCTMMMLLRIGSATSEATGSDIC